MALTSMTSPIAPPRASISRTICPFATPPIAGLQLICPTVSAFMVKRAVRRPMRADARAASVPACVRSNQTFTILATRGGETERFALELTKDQQSLAGFIGHWLLVRGALFCAPSAHNTGCVLKLGLSEHTLLRGGFGELASWGRFVTCLDKDRQVTNLPHEEGRCYTASGCKKRLTSSAMRRGCVANARWPQRFSAIRREFSIPSCSALRLSGETSRSRSPDRIKDGTRIRGSWSTRSKRSARRKRCAITLWSVCQHWRVTNSNSGPGFCRPPKRRLKNWLTKALSLGSGKQERTQLATRCNRPR